MHHRKIKNMTYRGAGFTMFINVYNQHLGYGGPEEGGWWYTILEPIKSIKAHGTTMKVLRTAYKYDGPGYEGRWLSAKVAVDEINPCFNGLIKRLEKEYPATGQYRSCCPRDDYIVCIEPKPAELEPKTRPHYE